MLLRYLFILLIIIPIKAFALIEVDITRGNLNPLPVAVSPLSIDNKSKENFKKILKQEDLGSEISIVVENNLRQSGLFNPLDKNAFLQEPDVANLKPRFEDWNLIKAQALVTGKVTFVDEKLRVEFRLWDVLAGKEMMALAFTTVPSNWRRVGHIITDKVYERLTGEKGYFDTRIIYVSEEGPKTKRIKKLAIMDQDGFNNKYLTLGNELVLTPRFSPTNQMVTYLSYFRNLPRVYLLDIETGMQEVVGDFPGMTFAPRFSPDGKKIRISIPEGCQNGRQLRLKGKGMPVLQTNRLGDLYIEVRVEVPTKLNNKQKKILKEFSEINSKSTSPETNGYLDSIKKLFTG